MAEDLLTQGLRNLANAITGTADFRNDDIVIPLDVGTAPDSDEVYIYVGKDGEGEIRTIEPDKLQTAQENGLGNFKSIRDLSEAGAQAYADQVAERAAGLIMDHLPRNHDGTIAYLPYDVDSDGVGVPKSLAELEPWLREARDSFVPSDHPPLSGGKHSDPERQAAHEAELRGWGAMNRTLEEIRIVEDIPAYKADLATEAEAELTYHGNEIVQSELNYELPEAAAPSTDPQVTR